MCKIDLVFSRLVELAAENSTVTNVVLRGAMVEFIMQELKLDRIPASQLTDLIVNAVKDTDEGLGVINDRWYAAELRGEDSNNPMHSAYYYKRAAKAIVKSCD